MSTQRPTPRRLRTSVRIDRCGYGHTELTVFTAHVPDSAPDDVTHARAGQLIVSTRQAAELIGRLAPVRITAAVGMEKTPDYTDLLRAVEIQRIGSATHPNT